ncbi:MAG: hypothetical protein IPG72_07180 [Ardenticatenales bacterium]|nr:hypothetical protein [Ardenticatenales bacterium]
MPGWTRARRRTGRPSGRTCSTRSTWRASRPSSTATRPNRTTRSSTATSADDVGRRRAAVRRGHRGSAAAARGDRARRPAGECGSAAPGLSGGSATGVRPPHRPLVGYDFSRGHFGTTVHPFASSFSQSDCRITTRWNPAFISPSLFGTLHECGHAIYEQHTSPVLARTPLARGTSSGIHESQSRMIENIVGRSQGFWRAHFGALQSHFPSQLANTTADEFWRAVNHVGPSFIRVEADERTHNLHIILRFGLERALIGGTLAVADARDAWNAAMEDLLDMTPPDDAHGILQDVHWSSPMFGYFPTYALREPACRPAVRGGDGGRSGRGGGFERRQRLAAAGVAAHERPPVRQGLPAGGADRAGYRTGARRGGVRAVCGCEVRGRVWSWVAGRPAHATIVRGGAILPPGDPPTGQPSPTTHQQEGSNIERAHRAPTARGRTTTSLLVLLALVRRVGMSAPVRMGPKPRTVVRAQSATPTPWRPHQPRRLISPGFRDPAHGRRIGEPSPIGSVTPPAR